MIRTSRFSWLLAVQVSELFQALLSQSELYHVCQHHQYNICMLIIKKMKVRWSGHVVREKGTLANTILQSKVGGKDHGEGQQDSGGTMQRNGQSWAWMRRGGSQRTVWAAESVSLSVVLHQRNSLQDSSRRRFSCHHCIVKFKTSITGADIPSYTDIAKVTSILSYRMRQ